MYIDIDITYFSISHYATEDEMQFNHIKFAYRKNKDL